MSSDDEQYIDSESEQEEEEIEDQILDEKSIESEMLKQIVAVQSTVDTNEGIARLLLQKHKWNNDSLTDKFYESPDRISFLIESDIIPKEMKPLETGEGECDICCDEAELVGLECNHRSCKMCWKSYLTEKIKEGQTEIECMDSKCKLLVEDGRVMQFLSDETIIASYKHLILNKYVQTSIFFKWCPGVDCGKAVKSSHVNPHMVSCTCGTNFCFCCTHDWHDPVNCRHMKLWMKKCGESAENAQWIINNTKDCPKCLAQIEKNGGCNFIRCTNTTCGYQFCWICMNAWSVHAQAWYSCNSFDQAAETNREKYRTNKDRYIFYFNRYRGHEESLKLESKLKRKVALKMEKMQEMSMSFAEVQFLGQAVEVLSKCRRTMMLTYVFAYYLEKNNHSLIFEANQKDLEMATEQLSGFLEQDLEKENLSTLKQSVQDKSRYVEHRRNRLLDHCAEGNEQNNWVFNE